MFTRRRLSPLAGLLLVLLAAGLFWAGCGDETRSLTAPPETTQNTDQGVQVALTSRNPALRAAIEVQDLHTPSLMTIADVVGTAASVDASGVPVIKIYTVEKSRAGLLPTELDGIPVVEEVSGVIVAMKGPPGGGGGGGHGGVSHTAIQSPPIQLGTSGGWRYDLANGYCCGGTLGSLISKGGTQYILSNYHVLYADIVSGGNNRTAQPGDPVVQPGLIDVNCSANGSQNVATLVANGGSLPGANVDAGIAQVISGMVRTDGAILEIGTISSQTVSASVGQKVKKSGRTTGLSRSSVDGLNATVSVSYENECAGGSAFTKTYTGQIIVKNRGSKFLAGGDSGSLMVEDVSNNPRAVGLLFAGSSSLAVANPIDDVLSFYNASMVGN
jgi:hypothetical protein